MKAKKRKARVFWIVWGMGTFPKAFITKTYARIWASKLTIPKIEIIKVTEQLPKRRGK